jgi:hypothetical protein
MNQKKLKETVFIGAGAIGQVAGFNAWTNNVTLKFIPTHMKLKNLIWNEFTAGDADVLHITCDLIDGMTTDIAMWPSNVYRDFYVNGKFKLKSMLQPAFDMNLEILGSDNSGTAHDATIGLQIEFSREE